ncbi:MAG TPA: DUF4203 domain-containing protein [Candidatus Saccharibacteria bacterium]|nr:DUF4203 domain-containing protein [Candidatus Saccharibacteria bacterium]
MKEVIFALLAGGLGVLLLTAGYRFARILIPLWAFFAGFSVGAAVFADATSVGFIATTMCIVTGLIIGFVFALFAYFFYSLAVVLLGATTGYWIGTAFMSWIGFSKGFLSAVVGISLGVVFALATIGLNVAKYLLVALTSMAGAVALVGGILVLFNKIELSAFDYTTASAVISNSVLWTIVTFVLISLGIVIQIITTNSYVLDDWTTEYGAPKK